MRKTFLILLCAFAAIFLFPTTVHADMGPKPSVVINFNGLDGTNYYATLLSSVSSTGPHSAVNGSNQDARYRKGEEGYDVFQKFVAYKDVDGFYFLQFFQDCSQTQQFSWTYYPPKEFKILIYFPENDRFVVSDESYERYAFDSYFSAEVSGTGLFAAAQGELGITVKKTYDYTKELLSLLVRILLTIIIELGIARVFGFREKRQFRFIVLVNIGTQVALNIALNIINYRSGHMAFVLFYMLLEFVVFIVEAILYTWYLKRCSERRIPGWKPAVYALAANAASFALGWELARWFGIF